MKPTIHIRDFGGLGNKMMRYMFADWLGTLTGYQVTGFNMPEWNLISPHQSLPAGRPVSTGRVHKVDIERIFAAIESGNAQWIDVECFAMRLEYFRERRSFFVEKFKAHEPSERVSDNEIAINIRTGDTIDGLHPDYTPLPINFYHRLAFETGLKPVFIGQVSGNWYTDNLRGQFKDARFIELGAVEDFKILRSAKNIAVAVSSFSWLAAYLSDAAAHVHLPVSGLYNRINRPDIDLLPIDQDRYIFHHLSQDRYFGDSVQKSVISSTMGWQQPISEITPTYLGYSCASPEPKIHSAQDVAGQIIDAVESQTPFCFVRLGDGEGNLLHFDLETFSPTDLAYFEGHFGSHVSAGSIIEVAENLKDAISSADLIGVRDDIWLANENVLRISENDPEFFTNFREYFPLRSRERTQIDEYGARRVFRLFCWARDNFPKRVPACSQWHTYDLASNGFWKRLLKRLGRFSLIHCSPTLPSKLAAVTGAEISHYLVPDKANIRAQWHDLVEEQGNHFPEAFEQISERVRDKAAGQVFLVGAGLVGKGYLKAIKDGGGIALDLGALLDAWDGRATRPQILAQKTGNRWSPGDRVPRPFILA